MNTLRDVRVCVYCMVSIAAFSPVVPAQDPPRSPEVEAAVHILQNRDWADRDPWIQRLKDLNARSEQPVGGDIAHEIEEREVQALSVIISSESLPPDERADIIRGCADHEHGRVRCLAAWQLVLQGLWNGERALAFARKEDSLGAWNAIMPGVRRLVAREEAMPIANEALRMLIAAPDAANTDQVALLREAVRVLARSTRQVDKELLEAVLREYPEEPLVWLSVSRIEVKPEVMALAREVNRHGESLTLRCAAGLVVAKEDPGVYAQLADQIVAYAKEFAGPSYRAEAIACYRTRGNPECREQAARRKTGSGLAGVLFELPEDVLVARAAELGRYNYGDTGIQNCAVLALRIPNEFLEVASQLVGGSEEIRRALLLLGQQYPPLQGRVEDAIPPDVLAELRTRLEESDHDTFLMGALPKFALVEE